MALSARLRAGEDIFGLDPPFGTWSAVSLGRLRRGPGGVEGKTSVGSRGDSLRQRDGRCVEFAVQGRADRPADLVIIG